MASVLDNRLLLFITIFPCQVWLSTSDMCMCRQDCPAPCATCCSNDVSLFVRQFYPICSLVQQSKHIHVFSGILYTLYVHRSLSLSLLARVVSRDTKTWLVTWHGNMHHIPTRIYIVCAVSFYCVYNLTLSAVGCTPTPDTPSPDIFICIRLFLSNVWSNL